MKIPGEEQRKIAKVDISAMENSELWSKVHQSCHLVKSQLQILDQKCQREEEVGQQRADRNRALEEYLAKKEEKIEMDSGFLNTLRIPLQAANDEMCSVDVEINALERAKENTMSVLEATKEQLKTNEDRISEAKVEAFEQFSVLTIAESGDSPVLNENVIEQEIEDLERRILEVNDELDGLSEDGDDDEEVIEEIHSKTFQIEQECANEAEIELALQDRLEGLQLKLQN